MAVCLLADSAFFGKEQWSKVPSLRQHQTPCLCPNSRANLAKAIPQSLEQFAEKPINILSSFKAPLPLNMAPKSAPPAAKQQLILDWFHKSLSAHSFKDLEKALPSVASISGMVVKDYLQALSDEGLIRVEKIGSGNWYWAFVSDAKNGKEKVLNDLKNEDAKARSQIAELDKQIAEEMEQREDDDEMLEDSGMDRNALLEAHGRLTKEVQALEMELKTYSGNDPTELLRQEKESLLLKESAERWTDNIESIQSYILDLTHDRAQVALMMQTACGDEYIMGEGLKELI